MPSCTYNKQVQENYSIKGVTRNKRFLEFNLSVVNVRLTQMVSTRIMRHRNNNMPLPKPPNHICPRPTRSRKRFQVASACIDVHGCCRGRRRSRMRSILVVVEFGGLKLVCIVIAGCFSFAVSCRHGVAGKIVLGGGCMCL